MLSSISSCTTARNVSGLQQTASRSTTNSPGAGTATDTVSLSKEGRTASLVDGLWDAMGVTPNSDGNIDIESIRDCYENDTICMEKQLRTRYRQLGVSSDSEMKITIGHNGKAVVSGKSPAAEALSDAINADPELLNTIRRASANASMLTACEEAEAFRAAYADNPYAAVERYGYLVRHS